MNNLYDILEVCLQEIENGLALDEILARYPEFAEELRPILQVSIHAQKMAVPAPAVEVVRRNRARLLQQAAQMREVKSAPRTSWFASFQRLTVALAFVLLFFVSGTSLVRAASSALPGDGLYSVKRSWEDVTVFFAFNSEARATLELEYENERLDELDDLFASGRIAKVDFVGSVTRQSGDGWRISNILVIVSEQTALPDQPVEVGAVVHVTGTTNGDGIVLAERIELLPPGTVVPEVQDDPFEIEAEKTPVAPTPDNGDSTPGIATEPPEVEITITPSPVATPKIESFEGILNSINKDVWMVNDIRVNVATAEIKGIPVIGAHAKVEGYYKLDGIFIAIKIEIINSGLNTGNVNSNNNDDNNTNPGNTNDTNSNTNTNDNGGGNSNNTNDDNGGHGGNNNNG